MSDEPARDELERLRSLLVAEERSELEELRRRLEQREMSAEAVAEVLPDAVLLQSTRGDGFANALAPTIGDSIQESVRKDPAVIADAIFPVIGPAIRKSIQQALSQTIESLNTTVEHTFTPKGLRWRMEAWRSGRSFGEVVLSHSLLWRAEQVFLIHGETGLVLEEVGIPAALSSDSDLVASMLTAIQDFCADSFHTEDEHPLHEISFDEHRVLIGSGPQAVLAVVMRGRAPAQYRDRMDEVLEDVHARFSQDLESFDGDTSRFAPCRPHLEKCLGEEKRESERSKVAVVAPILVGAGVLALGLFGSKVLLEGRAERRQAQRAFAALQSTPGIYVGSTEQVNQEDGAKWLVEGLRDVDSTAPEEILERNELDPSTVRMQWEVVRSFEPEIVARRAERLLKAPRGVLLSVQDRTLVARGFVPEQWLAEARASLFLVDGIDELVLGTELDHGD